MQSKFGKTGVIILAFVIVVAGVITGSFLARGTSTPASGPSLEEANLEPGKPPPPQLDSKTFRDKAVGVIEKNDIGDQYVQGTHRLIREGGPSQTAYLVSSVVDLNLYVGKKVEVWGETFSSTQVGWLMDVGKVNVLE